MTLIAAVVVPYPLSLDAPPVSLSFNQRRFRILASDSAVDTTVRICLGRDKVDILQRLARRLRQKGHQVLFVQIQ